MKFKVKHTSERFIKKESTWLYLKSHADMALIPPTLRIKSKGKVLSIRRIMKEAESNSSSAAIREARKSMLVSENIYEKMNKELKDYCKENRNSEEFENFNNSLRCLKKS